MTETINQSIALDQDRIKSCLDTGQLASLSKLEVFETIDSTNTYLLNKAKQQAVSGWAVFAEQQTHGRGRHGKEWVSPASGNLYCSMLWEFHQQDISSLSLAVGVMVVKCLQKYGIHSAGLKWPNDIIFANKKLGGILLERTGSSVIVGVGINLFLPATEREGLNAIDLAEIMGADIDRNKMAACLLSELLRGLPLFAEHGFGVFKDEWISCNVLRGKNIVVHDANKVFTGKMQGITLEGELILLDESGLPLRFRCGEVSVREE